MSADSWPYFPSLQQIRRTCPEEYFTAGQDCCREGGVESALMKGDTITVKVRWSGQARSVTLTSKNGSITETCACPDGRKGWWCWHVSAALLHVSEHMDEIKSAEEMRHEAIDHFVASLPPEKILDFVSRYMKSSHALYDRFVRDLNLQNVRVPRNYPKMMEKICADGQNAEYVTFERILKAARKERDAGEHGEAARAYQGMADHITDSMGGSPGAADYYRDCAIEAIDCMVDSVIRGDMEPDLKRPHMEYFFGRATDPSHRPYWPQYAEALEEIAEAGDMAHWLDLADSETSTEDGVAAQLARMRAHILGHAGRWEEAADALSGHYAGDPGLCVRLLGILRHVGGERALDGARKAVAAFPADARVLQEALPIFDGAEHHDLLMRLFQSTGEWGYFFRLKEASGDWNGTLDRLSGSLAPTDPERAIDVYLKEGMRQRAMDALESLDSHDMYAKYLPKLAKRFPDRYLESYGKRIRRLAKARTGRDHYAKVRDHLGRMQSIPAPGDAFGALVESIRSENAGRRTLLEALSGL